MSEPRSFGFFDFVLLLLTLAVAGGLRAGYLIHFCDSGHSAGALRVQDVRPSIDQLGGDDSPTPGPAGQGARHRRVEAAKKTPLAGYGGVTDLDDLVASLKESNNYNARSLVTNVREPSVYTSPGYPWILGLLNRVLDRDRMELSVRWGQCVLGALSAGLYFLFARRAFGSRLVAALAGLFCALHPFWIIDTATLDDGVVTTFLLAAVLFFGARSAQAGAAFSSLLYGLGLAALALTRAALLPFAVVSILWFLLRCRSVVRGWLCALLAFLGFVNGLAPWMVYNWQRFHEVIPIVDSMYAELWQGNYSFTEGKTRYRATGGPASLPALRYIRQSGAGLPRTHRYNELADSLQRTILNDPVGAVNRRLAAGVFFFFGERWFKDGQLAEKANPEGAAPPSAEGNDEDGAAADKLTTWFEAAYPHLLSTALLVMLVLGVLGWRWTFGWRTSAMPSSLAVMWIPLPYILSHAESLSGPRLPLDGVLLTYAAFAIGCLFSSQLLAGNRAAGRDAGRR